MEREERYLETATTEGISRLSPSSSTHRTRWMLARVWYAWYTRVEYVLCTAVEWPLRGGMEPMLMTLDGFPVDCQQRRDFDLADQIRRHTMLK